MIDELRWLLVAIPFVGLALLVGLLSILIGQTP